MYTSLTPSAEDYMKAIYTVALENRVVRIKDIAKMLKVKMPSVVNAIKSLSEKNLLVHESYSYIELTPAGLKVGKDVYDRHLVLYKFLRRVLQIDENIASKDACAIEHYLHPQTVERVVKLLDFTSAAPNSEPRWMKKFRKFLDTGISECKYAKTLDGLEIGKAAIIKSINMKGELKKRLMDMGMIKGEKIAVIKKAPLGDPIEFSIKGYSISLRKSEAKQIEIREENGAAING